MCFDGGLFESLIAPVVTGVFGSILGIEASNKHNAALDAQGANAQEAARIQAEQLAAQRDIEIQKQQIQADQVRGRLRAIAAEAGTGFGDTQQALEGSVVANQNLNTSIINKNYQSNIQANRVGLQGQLLALDAGQTNSALAGVTGGLSGFGTGLNIASGASNLLQPPVKQRAPYQGGYYSARGYTGEWPTVFGDIGGGTGIV